MSQFEFTSTIDVVVIDYKGERYAKVSDLIAWMRENRDTGSEIVDDFANKILKNLVAVKNDKK